jgi:hypothetical protein
MCGPPLIFQTRVHFFNIVLRCKIKTVSAYMKYLILNENKINHYIHIMKLLRTLKPAGFEVLTAVVMKSAIFWV